MKVEGAVLETWLEAHTFIGEDSGAWHCAHTCSNPAGCDGFTHSLSYAAAGPGQHDVFTQAAVIWVCYS